MFAVILALTGCGHSSTPRIDDQSRHVRDPAEQFRIVVKGDTLFSIAWETGKDFRDLAQWNGITPPYLIKPGQRLSMSPAKSGPIATARSYTVRRGDTVYSIARENGMNAKELAEQNGLDKRYLIRPGQVLILGKGGQQSPTASSNTEPKKAFSKATHTVKTRKPKTPESVKPAATHNWRWPVLGRLVETFDLKKGNKGIDIAAGVGGAIKAAESGQVVYRGSGLRGYGKLVIIKHDDDYLSAYAHCNDIYVKEGDMIKRGQKIASVGNSGAEKAKLHFEIRYRGNPVDPMKYLPKS